MVKNACRQIVDENQTAAFAKHMYGKSIYNLKKGQGYYFSNDEAMDKVVEYFVSKGFKLTKHTGEAKVETKAAPIVLEDNKENTQKGGKKK